jgi:hypothetical protein
MVDQLIVLTDEQGVEGLDVHKNRDWRKSGLSMIKERK